MKKTLLSIVLFSSFHMTISQLPDVKKSKKHIYLLVGQSNMAGRGKPEEIDTTTNPHIFMFTKNEQWVLAKEPMAFDKPSVVGVGPGFAFAREILKHDETATILLVPSAVGGTRIDLWKTGAYDSATKTHPYDDAIQRAKKAMESGELKGIIWHQGESDCTPALSNEYEAKLRELIKRFRTDLGKPSLPFIIGEISDFKGDNKETKVINDAIMNVGLNTKNCLAAESKGLRHKGDFIHYDAASARELGKRYALLLLLVTK